MGLSISLPTWISQSQKLPADQLPDLAISAFLGEVSSEAAMLAQTGQKGDWVVRTDEGKVYVITGDSPAQAVSWRALAYPVPQYTSSALNGTSNSILSRNPAMSAEDASVWKGRSLSAALDAILFPTVQASISRAKSASISARSGFTLSSPAEVGASVQRGFDVSFDAGQILNGGGALGPALVGASTSSVLTGPGAGAGIAGFTGGQIPGSVAVSAGSNTWTITYNHAAGTGAYTDSRGVAAANLDSSRAAGSAFASATVLGIYPYYYIKSPSAFSMADFKAAIATMAVAETQRSITSGTLNGATIFKVLQEAAGTLSIPYALNNQFFGVAYPSSYTEKTRYNVPASLGFDQGAISNIFVKTTDSSVSGATWSGGSYVFHIAQSPAINAATIIELRES